MGKKIPVSVMTGFLGSGKSTLLGRLLDLGDAGRQRPVPENVVPARNRIVVLTGETGNPVLRHARTLHIPDEIVPSTSGCACCGVRGALADALRSLFMDALQRRIEVFSHVMLETSGLADPAAVMYTLQYEPFLRDRYEYAGCVATIDGTRGLDDLSSQPEAVRQAVLADTLVVSKAEHLEASRLDGLLAGLREINPEAPVLLAEQLHEIAGRVFERQAAPRPMRPAGAGIGGASLWAGGGLRRRIPPGAGHIGVHVLFAQWDDAPVRGVFLRAIEALQADSQLGLLRLKGEMRFAGDARTWMVHGVHGQLYPMQALEQGGAQLPGALMMIFRPASGQLAPARVLSVLPSGARLLSSGCNSDTQGVAMNAP
jgi:G3E family GTPase